MSSKKSATLVTEHQPTHTHTYTPVIPSWHWPGVVTAAAAAAAAAVDCSAHGRKGVAFDVVLDKSVWVEDWLFIGPAGHSVAAKAIHGRAKPCMTVQARTRVFV